MKAASVRATIRDVARAAEVSPATVSRHVNGHLALPPGTARRIDAAIASLGYRPDRLAQRFSRGTAETIGLATPDIGNPFFAELAAAAEREAASFGYGLVLCTTGNALARELLHLDRLAARDFDGLVFLTNHGDDGTLARRLAGRRDVILLDEDVPGADAPRIFVENEAGGWLATRHLIEAGHRRIAHVSGPETLFSVAERFAGYARALAEAGLVPDHGLIRFGRYGRAFGREAVRDLLAAPGGPPTAVFAASDYIALGILEGVREAGLSVPRDLSLVGFDDMPFAGLLAPPITTIRQPVEDLGREAVRTLVGRLRGAAEPPAVQRLPVELVERGSVAPAPASLGRRAGRAP